MAFPADSGGGAPPAPLPVVGHQFCAPYVVPLTVTKKALSISDGDFAITDANGALVLKVKGSIFSMRHRRVLLDAAGQPLLSMQEKVFSMHHRWEVFRGDSTNASDLLFSVRKSSLIQFKTEMDVFLAGNTAQQVCDFKIKGNYFDRSCAFYLGNSTTMVAQSLGKMKITSKSLWITMSPSSRKTCRWRAAAAPPLPWIDRSPMAAGKSTSLSPRGPPPCFVFSAIRLDSTTFAFMKHSRQIRRTRTLAREDDARQLRRAASIGKEAEKKQSSAEPDP